MAKVQMTAADKKWRAQDDARTLIDAGAIKEDKGRMNRALTEVKTIASQKEKEAKAARKIAKAPKKKASPKKKK